MRDVASAMAFLHEQAISEFNIKLFNFNFNFEIIQLQLLSYLSEGSDSATLWHHPGRHDTRSDCVCKTQNSMPVRPQPEP
jgi:hypothetical protein